MHVTAVQCPDNVKQLAGLDADRTRLDDLGLGVAADRAVEIGADDADLVFADRLDQDIGREQESWSCVRRRPG